MAIIQGNAKQGSTRGFYPKVINGSLRFNDDDSAYLSWTPDATHAAGRATYTFSCWFKISGGFGSSTRPLFGAGGATWDMLYISSGDVIAFSQATETISNFRSNAVLRDPSAWYHIVLTVDTTQATDTDRVKCWLNGELVTWSTSTYPTPQNETSMIADNVAHYIGKHPNSTAYWDGYFGDMFFISGTALTADDFGETKNGVWVAKDYAGTFGTNGFYLTFEDDTQVEAFNATLHRGNGAEQSITGTGFSPDLVWVKNRDQADNHMLYDTVRGPKRFLNSNGTAAESYSSNDLESFDADGFTVQNDPRLNTSGESFVSWQWDAGANNAVTGHSSVTYTGDGGTQNISGFPFSPDLVWIKERSSTSSNVLFDTVRGVTNGLFSDSTSAESSTSTQLQVFDKYGFRTGSSGGTNESGQTYVAWAWDAGDSDPVSNTAGSITSTVKASTANGFSIVSYTAPSSLQNITVGHGLSSAPSFVITKNRTDAGNSWRVWHQDLATNGYMSLESTSAATTDATIYNGDPTSSVISYGTNGSVNTVNSNFIAYCFHDVTGKQKFSSYEGTGATQSITTGFRPGFLLIKNADYGGTGSEHWSIVDGSRSPFDPQHDWLFANGNFVENTNETNRSVTFTDTGFTINSTTDFLNRNGDTFIYAAFAGSYSDYITDYNTNGSIDSRVKANDTTGFSIVSYTGTGVNGNWGHGLSAAPDMVIIKNRDNGGMPWLVYHSSNTANPETDYLLLNSTAATTDFNTAWNDTSPTSTVFNVGTADGTNQSGYRHIAYCWSETTGYSKFGSYTGTGATGNTTTTGFKPAVVILKRTDSTGNWNIFDNTRSTDGNAEELLFPNSSSAEITSSEQLAFLSNGFEPNVDNHNLSGATYIYAAFADTREAAFWLDQSGNDNDWQPVNLDHNDTVADSPTNNFATLNPLNVGVNITLSDGNLKGVCSSEHKSMYGTMGMTSGKYYWEATAISGAATKHTFGITNSANTSAYTQVNGTNALFPTGTAAMYAEGDAVGVYNNNVYKNSSIVTSSVWGSGVANGDTVSVAFDADTGKIWFAKNGDWISTAATGSGDTTVATGETYVPAFSMENCTWEVNFGQQPFKYDPPA